MSQFLSLSFPRVGNVIIWYHGKIKRHGYKCSLWSKRGRQEEQIKGEKKRVSAVQEGREGEWEGEGKGGRERGFSFHGDHD